MNINDNLESISTPETVVKNKIKGKATIELRDAKTGDLLYHKEEYNILTNFFNAMFEYRLCGQKNYEPKTLYELIKGIKLVNSETEEDSKNVTSSMHDFNVTGYGNLQVNSQQTDTKWMTYNLIESGPTDNGYKFVWDANPNQCNGNIECINLVSYDPVSKLYKVNSTNSQYQGMGYFSMYSTSLYPMYLGKRLDTPKNANPDLKLIISNPVHYDFDTDELIEIKQDLSDLKHITLKKYKLNRNTIKKPYGLAPKLLEEHEINFSNELWYDYTSNSSYITPYSVKVEGDIMWIVRRAERYKPNSNDNYSNKLRVIKINLNNYNFTDNTYTLPQNFIQPYYNNDNNYNKPGTLNYENRPYFMKDVLPIKDGYVYLLRVVNSEKYPHIYKLNLNNSGDFTECELNNNPNAYGINNAITASARSGFTTYKTVVFGNIQTTYSSKYYVGEYDVNNGIIQLNSYSMEEYDVTSSSLDYQYVRDNDCVANIRNVGVFFKDNMIYALRQSYTTGDNDCVNNGYLCIIPVMANNADITINNVTPVTKTSDKTMRVIYELINVDESEE